MFEEIEEKNKQIQRRVEGERAQHNQKLVRELKSSKNKGGK